MTGDLGIAGLLTKDGPGSLSLPLPSGTLPDDLTIADGELELNYGGNAVVFSGSIAGTASGVLTLTGTGASANAGFTLTETNPFPGETHVYGRRIFLDSAGGNAISGDYLIERPLQGRDRRDLEGHRHFFAGYVLFVV